VISSSSFAKDKIVIKDEHGKVIETIKPYSKDTYKVYNEHGKVIQTIKKEKQNKK
jgi:hypothetical protein